MVQEPWRKWLRFRCTGCGNCCRGTVVMITDEDACRIRDGTGQSAASFLSFATDDDLTLDKRSPWWIQFETGRAVMVLRQRRDHCVFLAPDNSCLAYEHRPVVCREHPFNITMSVTGGALFLSRSNIVPCPHEWDGHTTVRDLISLRRWNDRQSDAYTAKVRAWNRGRGERRTRAGFLRYLGLDGAADRRTVNLEPGTLNVKP